MVCFWLSSKNALHMQWSRLIYLSLPQKHLSFYQRQKIVRLCPSLEYTRKNQKWWTIPKNTTFLPQKWWLIPNIHTKTYIKWWQHTKHRIQYNHKYVRITKTLYCPPHANKIIKLSVLHAHIFPITLSHNMHTYTTYHNTTSYQQVIHIPKHSKHNTFA